MATVVRNVNPPIVTRTGARARPNSSLGSNGSSKTTPGPLPSSTASKRGLTPCRARAPAGRPPRPPRAASSRTPGSAGACPSSSRTRRRRGTPSTPRGGARRAPARACGGGSGARSLQGPEDADDLAEDADVAGVDRLERRVLGLETDPVGLAVEGLDRRLVRRLVVAGERDHDLAVPRRVLAAHDDDVAIEDPGLDHRVAADAQEEVGVAAEGRQAWQLDHVRRIGALRLPAHELEGPRLRRVALEQARALEVREVGVHGRGR